MSAITKTKSVRTGTYAALKQVVLRAGEIAEPTDRPGVLIIGDGTTVGGTDSGWSRSQMNSITVQTTIITIPLGSADATGFEFRFISRNVDDDWSSMQDRRVLVDAGGATQVAVPGGDDIGTNKLTIAFSIVTTNLVVKVTPSTESATSVVVLYQQIPVVYSL